jgi:nicotinamidase-related amidase
VRTLIRPDGSNRLPHWKRDGRWECVEGTPGAEAPPELAARPGEHVLGKPFYSAFGNADVDRLLRAAVVDTLLVAGTYTHACVRATVLDAYQRGYRVWLASAAVGSYDPVHAEISVRHLDGRACEALATSEILARVQSGRSSAM